MNAMPILANITKHISLSPKEEEYFIALLFLSIFSSKVD